MRTFFFIALLIALSTEAVAASAKKQPPPVDHFVIARDTFFDFGPPFNYYEIYLVKQDGDNVSVRRVYFSLRECEHAMKVEFFSATLPTTISQLFEGRNPCAISDRDIRRERNRHKKDLVFSGAVTTLQLQCGESERRIQTNVFDRDWFAKDPGTPENTSWTMRLLQTLNRATGPNVMDEPAFAVSSAPNSSKVPKDVSAEIESGEFDSLFGNLKVSDVFRDWQPSAPSSQVRIVTSEPVAPLGPDPIRYPPLALAANVGGVVHVRMKVAENGNATEVRIEGGHPMLKGTVEASAAKWKFDRTFAGQEVHATIEFNTGCVRRQHEE